MEQDTLTVDLNPMTSIYEIDYRYSEDVPVCQKWSFQVTAFKR